MNVTFIQDEVGLVQFYHADEIWARVRNDHVLVANAAEDALG